MIIEICSREKAAALADAVREATAVISITSTDEQDVRFPENGNLAAIFRLRINDLTAAFDEEGIPWGRPLPKQEDFTGLRAFLLSLRCRRLIVHCWKGASRSAAVAAAVFEFRDGADRLTTHGRFAPNPLVYALSCRELGISPGGLHYRAVPRGLGVWALESAPPEP